MAGSTKARKPKRRSKASNDQTQLQGKDFAAGSSALAMPEMGNALRRHLLGNGQRNPLDFYDLWRVKAWGE